MMVEIKVGYGKECQEDIIIHTSMISLSKILVDDKWIRQLHIKDPVPDCSSYFELTETEFQTARQKLLEGKPNTVIEISS